MQDTLRQQKAKEFRLHEVEQEYEYISEGLSKIDEKTQRFSKYRTQALSARKEKVQDHNDTVSQIRALSRTQSE